MVSAPLPPVAPLPSNVKLPAPLLMVELLPNCTCPENAAVPEALNAPLPPAPAPFSVITRAVGVSATLLISSVAPSFTNTLLVLSKPCAWLMLNVPPSTTVAPVNVFAFANTAMPLPVLMMPFRPEILPSNDKLLFAEIVESAVLRRMPPDHDATFDSANVLPFKVSDSTVMLTPSRCKVAPLPTLVLPNVLPGKPAPVNVNVPALILVAPS